ncbi:uncharacterized protein AMSG_08146 [Thecamonas trahens ATCC 50062]|uniref:Uncharacterized protein n=1 Tax=Thecamonas trahens ATCC 50062 TaxID=461836 RepID=A0A0L0DI44_THETB|nr:hypothetical protein AMSG_08146 [Thecamonas trahens ATCC 50062]KNC51910.1 hypothetical protein AMSG_08146 [Thecamonas trahens ATCC 50062]|eukprot:XP_013755507.1 hypothetical protein AMSG_08146 [Thecamonas trahens ATCC 50062]
MLMLALALALAPLAAASSAFSVIPCDGSNRCTPESGASVTISTGTTTAIKTGDVTAMAFSLGGYGPPVVGSDFALFKIAAQSHDSYQAWTLSGTPQSLWNASFSGTGITSNGVVVSGKAGDMPNTVYMIKGQSSVAIIRIDPVSGEPVEIYRSPHKEHTTSSWPFLISHDERVLWMQTKRDGVFAVTAVDLQSRTVVAEYLLEDLTDAWPELQFEADGETPFLVGVDTQQQVTLVVFDLKSNSTTMTRLDGPKPWTTASRKLQVLPMASHASRFVVLFGDTVAVFEVGTSSPIHAYSCAGGSTKCSVVGSASVAGRKNNILVYTERMMAGDADTYQRAVVARRVDSLKELWRMKVPDSQYDLPISTFVTVPMSGNVVVKSGNWDHVNAATGDVVYSVTHSDLCKGDNPYGYIDEYVLLGNHVLVGACINYKGYVRFITDQLVKV